MTRARALVWLTSCALACAGVVAGGASATTPPRLLRGYGTWTFAQLGYKRDVYQPGRGLQVHPFMFRLPRGTREGAFSWYLARVILSVTVDDHARPGEAATLEVETDNAIFANLRFVRTNQSGRKSMRWSGQSEFSGLVSGHCDGRCRVTFANYFQILGVRGGVNTLDFGVIDPNHLVKSFVVLPNSAIISTRNAPGNVELSLVPTRMHMRLHRRFWVEVVFLNGGGSPAKIASLSFLYDRHWLRRATPLPSKLPTVPAHTRRSLRVAFLPLRLGHSQLGVAADASSNHPAYVSQVTVTR